LYYAKTFGAICGDLELSKMLPKDGDKEKDTTVPKNQDPED